MSPEPDDITHLAIPAGEGHCFSEECSPKWLQAPWIYAALMHVGSFLIHCLPHSQKEGAFSQESVGMPQGRGGHQSIDRDTQLC